MKRTLLLAALCFVISCDSKFVESSPDTIKVSGAGLDERLKNKELVDQKIAEINRAVSEIKRLIEVFRMASASVGTIKSYTPIDYLLEINREFKNKIPAGNGDEFVRSMNIKKSFGPEDCRDGRAFLVTKKNGDMVYSVSPCIQGEPDLELLTAKFEGAEMTLTFHQENLSYILNEQIEKLNNEIDRAIKEEIANSNCKVNKNQSGEISDLDCRGFIVDLSKREKALIETLKYSSTAEISLEVLGKIQDYGQDKASFEFSLSRDRKVKFELDKIEADENSN